MSDHRQHKRTALKAQVKLILSDRGEIQLTMKDLSNGGLFLLTEGAMQAPPLGSLVKVQIMGMMDNAPVIRARVVRVDRDGFGLQFTD